MRKIVLLSFLTLDGVVQAPGGREEDVSGGFKHGGWVTPFFDESLGQEMEKQMAGPFDLLLGHKTYDIFASYWPYHLDEWPGLVNAMKYVVSRHPVKGRWDGTSGVTGGVPAQIRALKALDGPVIQVHGSGEMAQTLFEHGLVDELWLKFFPITLGQGKRLFGPGTRPANFRLTSSSVTPGGVLLARYEKTNEVQP